MIIVELVQQGQPSDLDPGHERQQESGVLSRRWDSGLAQPIRCLGQQQPDRLAHRTGSPTWERRSWVSASCKAVITACRSPFST